MLYYIMRRLMLLPLTLFAIILVNFVIVNLAPGDPVTLTEVSQEGLAVRKDDRASVFGSDERYLHFREHYGLTLPILFNRWPFMSREAVLAQLTTLVDQKPSATNPNALSVSEYNALRTSFGDGSRFMMPHLIAIVTTPSEPFEIRRMAMRFFVRGGSRQAYLGPNLTPEQKAFNKKIALDTSLLTTFLLQPQDTSEVINHKIQLAQEWYLENRTFYYFEPSLREKIKLFFFETRFWRYMSRVLTLDFGTLRNDHNKTVISEVTKRFKYSLTLAIIPMILTFFLCQFFAFIMALKQQRWPDHLLNVIFLLLYAVPVFVVVPFLIEIAIHRHFPFTNIPIPLSGFTSPDAIYNAKTSLQRLFDVIQHLILPMIAVMYGSLAAQTRLSRTAILEVLRQDYVRTAWAKGATLSQIMIKHVGRNAAVTIVTSLASSLGIVLGGSLIVETLFEINGFGKFFYDAVVNRDYNVIMFSTLAGSFLSLIGYLLADIAYTWLDPRVTLD
jgi:peptide/nickel transport system permease protein